MATTNSTDLEKQQQEAYDLALSSVSGAKPTYAGTFDQQVQDMYDKIVNREKFSYDASTDPMYQMSKDRYTQLGKLAMKDTIGQAAALTGGYGNTYGQQVGQQAYDAQLQNLSDVIPELYEMAYSMYSDEGDKLNDQYSMLLARQADEYDKYRDALSDYNYEQELATEKEQQEYERQVYADQLAYEQKQNNYSNLLTLISGSGYTPTDDELEAAGMTREAADALAAEYTRSITGTTATSSGSSSGSSGSGSSYSADTAAMQQKLNAMGANLVVDGIWGSKTQAAYEKYILGSSSDDSSEAYTYQDLVANATEALAQGYSQSEVYNALKSSDYSGGNAGQTSGDITRAMRAAADKLRASSNSSHSSGKF